MENTLLTELEHGKFIELSVDEKMEVDGGAGIGAFFATVGAGVVKGCTVVGALVGGGPVVGAVIIGAGVLALAGGIYVGLND